MLSTRWLNYPLLRTQRPFAFRADRSVVIVSREIGRVVCVCVCVLDISVHMYVCMLSICVCMFVFYLFYCVYVYAFLCISDCAAVFAGLSSGQEIESPS